jgi:hypothetical protein
MIRKFILACQISFAALVVQRPGTIEPSSLLFPPGLLANEDFPFALFKADSFSIELKNEM